MQIRKVVKLFTDGMILYVEKPKEPTIKTNKLINRFNKGSEWLILKNEQYFYTVAINKPKMKLRKQLYLQQDQKNTILSNLTSVKLIL